MKQVNPFKVQGFQGKAYFCDRESELESLFGHVLNDRNIVLHAWRRLGKTALLQYFKQEIEKKHKADVLYIDLLGTNSMQQANAKLVNEVYHHYGKIKVSGIQKALQQLLGSLGFVFSINPITLFPEVETSVKPKKSPDLSLNQIGEFLNKQEQLTILILDEFQEITKFKDVEGEAVFRSFAQSFANIRIIYSGSERNLLKSMFSDKNRPFYKSTQLMALESIPLEKYQNFIQRFFGKKNLSEDLINDIYDWARGQTYLIQLQCNRLFELNKPITFQDVFVMRESLLKQEAPVFGNYTNLLSTNQFNLLKALAKHEPVTNPQSIDFLKQNELGAASTVSSAIKSLIDKELVIKENNAYMVHDVLFAKWLEKI